mmetsp:Transcript_76320/g.216268  ORF Transcript_76320/g.216268 Transcript_76320/m.216268 type:complete len:242 (+) Transcript_76320:582-1307(+)
MLGWRRRRRIFSSLQSTGRPSCGMPSFTAFTATRVLWYRPGTTMPKPPLPRTLPLTSSTSPLAMSHCSRRPMARIWFIDSPPRPSPSKAKALLVVSRRDMARDRSEPTSSRPAADSRRPSLESRNSAWKRLCFSARNPANIARSCLSKARFPTAANTVSARSPTMLKWAVRTAGLPSVSTGTANARNAITSNGARIAQRTGTQRCTAVTTQSMYSTRLPSVGLRSRPHMAFVSSWPNARAR